VTRERLGVTAGLTLLVASMVGIAAGLGSVARVVPLVIGIPTLGLALAELARDFAGARASPAGEDARSTTRERLVIGWVVLLPVCMAAIGVVFGVPLWLAVVLRVFVRDTWRSTVTIGAVLAAVLYVVLHLLLRLDATAGALVSWPT